MSSCRNAKFRGVRPAVIGQTIARMTAPAYEELLQIWIPWRLTKIVLRMAMSRELT